MRSLRFWLHPPQPVARGSAKLRRHDGQESIHLEHARIYRLVMKLECPSILCPLHIISLCHALIQSSCWILLPASLSIDPNMNFFLLWSKQWQAHAPNGRASTGVFRRLVHG